MVKRVLRIAIALILGVCLCSLIATLSGTDLTVQGDWNLSMFTINMVSFATFAASMLLLVGFVFEGKWNGMLTPCIVFVAVSIIGFFTLERFIGFDWSGIVVSYVFPLCLLTYLAIRKKMIKKTVIRTLLWLAIMLPFMYAVVMIKTTFVPNWVYVEADVQGFLSTIDVIILAALLYLSGSKKSASLEPLINIGRGNDELIDAGSDIEHSRKPRGVFRVVVSICIIIAQLAVALFICKLGGVLIEGLIASVSMAIFGLYIQPRWRFKLKRKENESNVRYFLKYFAGNTLVSAGLFFVIGRTVQHFNYMLSAAVLLGLAATMLFSQLERVLADRSALRDELAALKAKPPFQCKTATADEIRARCLSLGKPETYAEFLVDAHRSGLRQKEIAVKYGLTTETVKEYKRKRTREVDEV